jgi:hypothetical protein
MNLAATAKRADMLVLDGLELYNSISIVPQVLF